MLFEDLLGRDLAIVVNITTGVLVCYLIIVTIISESFTKIKLDSENKKKKRKFWTTTKFVPIAKRNDIDIDQRNNIKILDGGNQM